jgi:DNA-binding transcriptional LysR family regulator
MPLPHRTPSVTALDLFVSVADLGSISRAAQAHGMSQPAASAAMARLERHVGVALLRRTPSGSALTDAGERLATSARDVIAAASELNDVVDGLRAAGGGRLAVAASYTVAEYLLPRWLGVFQRERPTVTVRVAVTNSAQVSAAVLAASADIGFVEGVTVPPRLDARAVHRDELVVVVNPDHPWAAREEPLHVTELAAARLVVRERGSGTREVLDELLRRHRTAAPPQPVSELGSTTAVKSAVLGGAGPAVLSRLAVDAELATGALKAVPVAGASLARTLHAVWRAGQRLAQPAAELLAHATPAGDDERQGRG